MTRHPIVVAASALLIVACGGGSELLALVPIVGPIGGQWQRDVPADSPTLQSVDGEFFNVGPAAGAAFDNYPTQANYDVEGDFGSASGPCASAFVGDSLRVKGSVTGDLLVLTRDDDPPVSPAVECLRARYVDSRTIEINASTRFRNTTPQFALERHEWVNADNAAQRFKFTQTGDATDNDAVALAGCRVTTGAARADFSASLVGYDTARNVGPRIADFIVAGTNFGIGELPSPREIEFGRNGGPRLLLRRVLAGATPIDCTLP